ncbi:MAG: epoxyqueuosine reductase QueH [Coriobacteriia bacterium]|nr:epoxyqueuosine reductase QueH [Coriobacteriia bacterium]MBN2823214.1 epoxyqueuosine reductase QueH [Coriobacteriia bacterium]
MKVMLHACCGPCLIEPFDALAEEHEVTVCYANPNIHPIDEYRRRLETLLEHADRLGVDVVEEDYDIAMWMRAVAGLEDDPASRCEACFRLRLGMAASRAAELGYDAVATTLTVSPYQDPDSIREAGVAACKEAGVDYLDTDFRDRYRIATERSRSLGMYRQNYCGCVLSDVEAKKEREARKARKAQRG